MEEIRDLPQAEFEVMEVLWVKGEATGREVHTELSKGRKVAYTTVATLLTRLKERGYVLSEERNFAYVYHPLIARDWVVRNKVDTMVKRVFKGSIAPLAIYIARNRELTDEQMALLEEIVNMEKSEGGNEDGMDQQ